MVNIKRLCPHVCVTKKKRLRGRGRGKCIELLMMIISGVELEGAKEIFYLTSGSSAVLELSIGACITFEFSINDLKLKT